MVGDVEQVHCVYQEVFLDDGVQRSIRHEARSVVHFDELGLTLAVDHYVEPVLELRIPQNLEAHTLLAECLRLCRGKGLPIVLSASAVSLADGRMSTNHGFDDDVIDLLLQANRIDTHFCELLYYNLVTSITAV